MRGEAAAQALGTPVGESMARARERQTHRSGSRPWSSSTVSAPRRPSSTWMETGSGHRGLVERGGRESADS